MNCKKLRRAGMLGALLIVTTVFFTAGCSSVSRVAPSDDDDRSRLEQAFESPNLATIPAIRPDSAKVRSDSGFVWPLREGKVTSLFGGRKRDYHEGIDIRANRGTPIYAARDGQVIYSSKKIRGYGNMIVIKHNDDFATVYAHNRKNVVGRGENVKQGQLLAYVGATGKATGPHLHFEIRKREIAQDPLLFLPQIREPSVASK